MNVIIEFGPHQTSDNKGIIVFKITAIIVCIFNGEEVVQSRDNIYGFIGI
jgi:hypothetical protein